MNYDEKDDLFDLFRAKEQALDEMPPDTAWQRLEVKLRQQKSTVQRRPRLEVSTTIIALVLFLLLVCGFVGVYIVKKAAEKNSIEYPK